MQKLMIFCPMKAEAKLIASYIPNSKRSEFGYTFETGQIVVSGKPGKEAIMSSISEQYKDGYIPILFGLAGSLVNTVSVGDVFQASNISSSDYRLLDLPCIDEVKSSSFFSSSIPIISAEQRSECNKQYNCELVEMEGYYFIKHFQSINICSYMIRVVSDTAEVKFKMPFSNEIRIGAKKAANAITKIIYCK